MGEVVPYREVCSHGRIDPSPMQLHNYRYDDGGEWVWYHGFYLTNRGTKLEICGKPEPWRWMKNLRDCVECGEEFSNPWVPACESCWLQGTYPSWQEIIRRDMRLT